MRKLLVVIFAITLLAGCVSNRTFKAEKQRIGRIEFQQMKNVDNLDQLREEYELNNQSVEKMLLDLNDELAVLKEDLGSANQDLAEMRSEFADYSEMTDAEIQAAKDKLFQTNEKIAQTETRIGQINDQITEINTVTTAQKAEFTELKDDLNNTITFNEDALIDLDQRIEALRSNVALSQEKLDAIDSKYSKNTGSTQTGDANLQEGQSKLTELQQNYSGTTTDTQGNTLDTAGRLQAIESKLQNEHESMAEVINIVADLEGDIDNLQKMIRETSDNTLASVDADLAANRDETKAKLTAMDSKLEEMKLALHSTKNDVGGELTAVRQNVTGIASELIVVANDLEAVTSKTAVGKARTDRAWNSYNNAKAYYDKGKYEQAIISLDAFTKAYPDHELTPNAYYWIAESYYAGKNYEKAIRQFQYVSDNFTTSHKAKDAQIKIAMCHANLGDVAMAKTELSEFKNVHPDYTNMKLVDRLIKGFK
ncbi:MAG TPA: tetratricopeptide repeat protein [Candidatus Cloacimonadota bacterium]|nr:tetratricopeptide repeat protein [Candidatus Cloacimonadota bacterium]HPS38492.1 tetratricopeptide repeat protein [Candidatus Cloacimonadota bacterium]